MTRFRKALAPGDLATRVIAPYMHAMPDAEPLSMVFSACAPPAPTRSAALGLKRGLLRHCPNCGAGPLFAGYLTVCGTCPACAHRNERYRADDGPAYFTILLIGHVVIAPLFALSVVSAWSPAILLMVGLPLTAAATLAILPFIKGGWIGVLWGVSRSDDDPLPERP